MKTAVFEGKQTYQAAMSAGGKPPEKDMSLQPFCITYPKKEKALIKQEPSP